MPSGPLAHICMLVEDLDQAIEDWTKILGVLDPGQLDQQLVRYEDFSGGDDEMRWATFVSDHGAEIQLMEPSKDSPLGKRLAKVGEHVHHICFTTDDPERAQGELKEQGINVGAETLNDPRMPWQFWNWALPPSTHGTLVEIAKPYVAVEGKWESAE